MTSDQAQEILRLVARLALLSYEQGLCQASIEHALHVARPSTAPRPSPYPAEPVSPHPPEDVPRVPAPKGTRRRAGTLERMVLDELRRIQPQGLRVMEVARFLDVIPSNASATLKRMVDNGLIEKVHGVYVEKGTCDGNVLATVANGNLHPTSIGAPQDGSGPVTVGHGAEPQRH